MNLLDKNGNIIQHGALIHWCVDDSDDNTTWQFHGIVHDTTQLTGVFNGTTQFVVYLGGGIDFGMGIGKHITFEEVTSQADNNDSWCRGISVVGEASDIPRILKKALIDQMLD